MDSRLIVLAAAIFLLTILASPPVRTWLKQKLVNRKRHRAHAGKVQCDDKDCSRIAIRLTPNGYYCQDHWEVMSKRRVNGGYVTWSHVLNHTLRKG